MKLIYGINFVEGIALTRIIVDRKKVKVKGVTERSNVQLVKL